MDWKACLARRIAKPVSIDDALIRALQSSSEKRLISVERLPLSGDTASSKLSLAYDALRELLEALALRKGFRIYNHECFKAFLKEIVGDSAAGDEFDEIRKERNAANYYGKDISPKEADAMISRIIRLRAIVSRRLTE